MGHPEIISIDMALSYLSKTLESSRWPISCMICRRNASPIVQDDGAANESVSHSMPTHMGNTQPKSDQSSRMHEQQHPSRSFASGRALDLGALASICRGKLMTIKSGYRLECDRWHGAEV